MKKLVSLVLLTSIMIVSASEVPTDPTEKYRNEKAYEAIIHDAYYEAQRYTKELPNAWKDAVAAFDFKDDDINFWTAVRTNNFVENVGNNLIILYPNFELYLTPEEQKAYIGLQLASLKADVEFDVGGSHETFYAEKITSFQKISAGLTAAGLLALYHKQLLEKSYAFAPTAKSIFLSKGAVLVGSCLALNVAKKLLKAHSDFKRLQAAQFEVVDKLGGEGLLSILEKQVHWARLNESWLVNKWHYLLGKVSSAYSLEANLESIKAYIEKKKTTNI